MGWQVVYYFKQLNKSRTIPNHKKILELATLHDLELFKPPDKREFASVLSDEEEANDASSDLSETDDDSE